MANVCNKCGNNLYGNKTKCPFCGEPISGSSSRTTVNRPNPSGGSLSSQNYKNNNNNTYSGYNSNEPYSGPQTQRKTTSGYDSGSGGWGLLGFCFPLVGIILFLVWQNEKPNTAKVCLNGALIGIVVGFVIGLFNACAGLA